MSKFYIHYEDVTERYNAKEFKIPNDKLKDVMLRNSSSQHQTLMSYFFCPLFVPGLHTQIPPLVYRSSLRSNYIYYYYMQ